MLSAHSQFYDPPKIPSLVEDLYANATEIATVGVGGMWVQDNDENVAFDHVTRHGTSRARYEFQRGC